jgi:hypothetical protein
VLGVLMALALARPGQHRACPTQHQAGQQAVPNALVQQARPTRFAGLPLVQQVRPIRFEGLPLKARAGAAHPAPLGGWAVLMVVLKAAVQPAPRRHQPLEHPTLPQPPVAPARALAAS